MMSTGKNKVVHSEGRNIVGKVIEFFDTEKIKNTLNIPIYQATKRAAVATGKSESLIKKIRKENKSAQNNDTQLSTPGKDRKVNKKIILDDMKKCIIRRKIQEYYTIKNEIPTLKKLRLDLMEDIDYNGSREHLRKVLHSIGFKFKKCQNKRKMLMEKSDIIFKRSQYLRTMQRNDNLGENKKQVIFLDETYIHPSYTVKKCWQDGLTDGVLTTDSVGQRWIIVHAGGEKGFVPGALCMFKSKTKSGDYHDEMNTINFSTWIKTQLVPNIPRNCIIVMDNASYHSSQINKPPTSANRKQEIEEWLTKNKIEFSADLRKCELLNLVKLNKPGPVYAIDDYLKSVGHTVVRLPPYHCDLNPIEYIWSDVKRMVADKNVNQLSANIEHITREAFEKITVDDWKRHCDHVNKLRGEYWDRDGLLEEIDALIIQVGEEGDSDSETEESDTNSCNSAFSEISGIEEL